MASWVVNGGLSGLISRIMVCVWLSIGYKVTTGIVDATFVCLPMSVIFLHTLIIFFDLIEF